MKKSVFAIYFAFFTSGIMCTILGAILPFMSEEYNLSYSLGGTLLSVHQVGNLFAVLFAGVFPYLVGRKKSTIILSSGLIIGFIIMMITGNPIALIIAFIVSGISKGTMSNISNVVIAEETQNKTAGLNILHAVFAIGALVAPVLVLIATKTTLGWKLSTAILVCCQIIALFLIGKSDISDTPPKKIASNEKSFLTSFVFWLNTFILFFYLCCESSVVGWLVTYFAKTGKMSMTFAQSSATFLWIMIMLGRILCAAISNKINKKALLVTLAFSGTGFFVLMLLAQNPSLIIVGLLGVGFSMSGIYPTTLATMPEKFTSSTVATGTTIGVATCGAVLMPAIVGFVSDNIGIAGGIATISIAFFCTMLLTIIKIFVK